MKIWNMGINQRTYGSCEGDTDVSGPEADTYPTPAHGWVCYHCGETFPGTFGGSRAAREHFGAMPDAIPGCRLRMRAGERSLLRRIRWLERELSELRSRVANEDTDKDREFYRMIADHAQALIREEEAGYVRGVHDARKEAAERVRANGAPPDPVREIRT